MLVEYKSLPESSRLFVFPSNRKFYSDELILIEEKVNHYVAKLEFHKACFKIEYGRFIVVIISDDIPMTIEELDKMTTFIFSLEKEFKISLIDKVNVCFKQGEYVQMKEIPDFKRLIKDKGVSKKTIVFDNLINIKKEFEDIWEMPAGESWIAHFF